MAEFRAMVEKIWINEVLGVNCWFWRLWRLICKITGVWLNWNLILGQTKGLFYKFGGLGPSRIILKISRASLEKSGRRVDFWEVVGADFQNGKVYKILGFIFKLEKVMDRVHDSIYRSRYRVHNPSSWI
jgi:hypothetical protein